LIKEIVGDTPDGDGGVCIIQRRGPIMPQGSRKKKRKDGRRRQKKRRPGGARGSILPPEVYEAFVERAAARGVPVEIRETPGRKMSEILMEFAGPLLAQVSDDEHRKLVIGISVLGWNYALFPSNERASFLESMRGYMPGMDAETMEKFLAALAERKARLFPDILRYILDFEFSSTEGRLELFVTSVAIPEGSRSEGPP
jgi:hypothetical protein